MTIREFLNNFRKNTRGATVIEYAILASIISVSTIGATTTIGSKVNTTFTTVGTKLSGASR